MSQLTKVLVIPGHEDVPLVTIIASSVPVLLDAEHFGSPNPKCILIPFERFDDHPILMNTDFWVGS